MQIIVRLVFPHLNMTELLNMLGYVTSYINTTFIVPGLDEIVLEMCLLS